MMPRSIGPDEGPPDRGVSHLTARPFDSAADDPSRDRLPAWDALENVGTWFAVLSQGRSGSTMLTRLLDSSPRIRCLGEAFGPGQDPPVYATDSGMSRRDWLIATLRDKAPDARGFKLPIEALLAHPGLLSDLGSLGARIVLLRRENKLAKFASVKLAQATGQWGSREPYLIQRIAIDPWELLSFLFSTNVHDRFLVQVAEAFPHFLIRYEELSDQDRLRALQEFLGVPPATLTTDTVRGREIPLSEAVTNRDEILRVLANTPFGPALRRWFEEGPAQPGSHVVKSHPVHPAEGSEGARATRRSVIPTTKRATAFHEARAGFTRIDGWRSWSADNRWLMDPAYVGSLVDAIRRDGFHDPIRGPVSPRDVTIKGANFRETISAVGVNSRHRAVLLEARDTFDRRADVYAPEAITQFAKRLRALFTGFVGSEYLAGDATVRPRVRHEDVQALSFGDGSFDGYISCEVIEHVPSIQRTLTEAHRVLRPGGVLIATFPFRHNSETGSEKARLGPSGQIEYLTEPEYHGNPLGGGSLVFTIPGWDILESCREVGFAEARIVVHSSRRYAITGKDTAAIFVLRARA